MGYYDIEDYKAYEKKQSDIDNEIKRLKDKIKKIKSDNSKEQRKARNHLMILIGAEILRCTDFNFETEDFDLQSWRSYCNQYAKNVSDQCINTKIPEEVEEAPAEPAEQSQEENVTQEKVEQNEESEEDTPAYYSGYCE